MGNIFQNFGSSRSSIQSSKSVSDSDEGNCVDGLPSDRKSEFLDSPFQDRLINRILPSDILEGLINYAQKILPQNQIYQLEPLDPSSSEYKDIYTTFRQKNKPSFTIRKIEKIYNPHLMTQYAINKKKYKMINKKLKGKLLFHGTRKSNIDNICRNNFDWRLQGANRGHKYGQGVSFSPIPAYATNYSDSEYEKVMFVAQVLLGKAHIGDENVVVPPEDNDYTTNQDKNVIVKYDDNTFYPAYLISYSGFDPSNDQQHLPKPTPKTLLDYIKKK